MYIFNKIREYESVNDLSTISENSIVFYGEELDDRGENIIKYLNGKYTNQIKVIYINTIDSFKIIELESEETIKRQNFLKYITKRLNNTENISLESTTLGYSELLTLLYSINLVEKNYKIKIYYVEPEKYNKKESDSYDLSKEYSNHKYIKPFILPSPHDSTSSEEATLISFLGFEENRLGRVLYESENKYNKLISIFPVPGFKFGWENISLSRHSIFLKNEKDIFYTPADNPYESYKLLKKITSNLPDERIVIMPIGTKPCSIGAAIFLINTKETKELDKVACKYDFPTKKIGRSHGISKIYEYYLYKDFDKHTD